jgi:H-type lectin domain
MMRLRPLTEHYHGENLDDIFARAVEGDIYNAAIETSTANVSVVIAVANTQVDTAITFSKPFAATPVVMLTLTGAANLGVYVNAIALNATTTGFTLRVNSGAAQTITCRWLVYGRRE